MFTRDQKIEMQRRAWEMRLRGVPQFQIAAELGISEGFVSGLLKKARAARAPWLPPGRWMT